MKIIKTTDILDVINIDMLEKVEPILWYYQGAFCVIPIQIVQNVFNLRDMYQKFPDGKTKQVALEIIWNDGIPVDPKVGYALLGE